MTDLPNYTQYRGLRQSQIDWLKCHGVSIWSMIRPTPIRLATGTATPAPHRFLEDPNGDEWLAFVEPLDVIYWYPKTGEMISWNGKAFALGEEAIFNAGTFALGGSLDICTDPLFWLQNGRKGIVVVEWGDAYERLRLCPRISIPESLVGPWRQHVKPPHMPNVVVRRGGRMAA